MPFGFSTLGSSTLGSGALTQASGPAPIVSSITITPVGTIVLRGATMQFYAVVAGENNPSQAVTWSVTIGTVDATGLYTAPLVNEDQVGTITARSALDPTKSQSVTFAVYVAPPAGGQFVTRRRSTRRVILRGRSFQ